MKLLLASSIVRHMSKDGRPPSNRSGRGWYLQSTSVYGAKQKGSMRTASHEFLCAAIETKAPMRATRPPLNCVNTSNPAPENKSTPWQKAPRFTRVNRGLIDRLDNPFQVSRV